jgi:hypothetical protein
MEKLLTNEWEEKDIAMVILVGCAMVMVKWMRSECEIVVEVMWNEWDKLMWNEWEEKEDDTKVILNVF